MAERAGATITEVEGARHHDLAAPGLRRRHPDRGRRGLVTAKARPVQPLRNPAKS
jgi:hypothetical protein